MNEHMKQVRQVISQVGNGENVDAAILLIQYRDGSKIIRSSGSHGALALLGYALQWMLLRIAVPADTKVEKPG